MTHPVCHVMLSGIALALVLVPAGLALGEVAAAPLDPADVAARIQRYRTAEVTLTVLDAAGKPAAGATVTMSQTRHAFLFGCNGFALKPQDTSPAQQAYQQRFTDLLNFATLPFYWGSFEPQEGKTATDRIRAMAEWFGSRGLATKGHPLCWHQVDPPWLKDRPVEEVQKLQMGRITRDVTAFTGLIERWDVVNEAVVMPTYKGGANPLAQWCAKLGRVELIKQTFAAARAADPKATLILNDFDTSDKYEALIRECLDAGVPVQVIGIQSHMHSGYWGAQRSWQVCERFARFGKPLHFTELTLPSGEVRKNINWQGRESDWFSTPEGEARQAREVTEFYRTLFSHPAVQAITWWDFSDAGAWLGAPAGLLRKDMTPKPAYEALLKMIKKEWWTGPLTLKADADGKVKFRGFLGAYSVEAGGQRATVDVPAAGEAAVTAKLAPAPK